MRFYFYVYDYNGRVESSVISEEHAIEYCNEVDKGNLVSTLNNGDIIEINDSKSMKRFIIAVDTQNVF